MTTGTSDTQILFRPVGPKELALIEASAEFHRPATA
jgi:hypothetical protein